MEIKYSVLTQDHEHTVHNVGSDLSQEAAKKLVTILLEGEDPNKLADIVISPVIRK